MKNKIFFALLCCTLSAGALFAQKEYQLPANINLETGADFASYKQDVVQAANWLEIMSLETAPEKRKAMNAFIVQWASGAPDIRVVMNEEIGRLYGVNLDLLAIYIGAYCRYCILHEKADSFEAAKAGVMAMADVYQKRNCYRKSGKDGCIHQYDGSG